MAALGKLGRLALTGTGLGALAAPQESEAAFGGILARGADTMMMDIARKMKAAGIGRDEIWQKTGWFQGPDQKWRFEIPDDEAVLNTPATPGMQFLGDMMNAPSVDAYTMTDVPVYGDVKGPSRGYYDRLNDAIGVNPTLTRDQQRSTLLHEIQHGIQNTEGFSRGGNARSFLNSRLTEEPDFDPFEFYRRLAGEVEARNVQFRDLMSPERRRQAPPWQTADTPESQQLMFDEGINDFRQAGYATPAMLGALSGLSGGALMAPRHPRVAQAADALRGLSRRLEGSPMGLLAPDATAEWLGKLAYGQKPTWGDRLGVLFDWM